MTEVPGITQIRETLGKVSETERRIETGEATQEEVIERAEELAEARRISHHLSSNMVIVPAKLNKELYAALPRLLRRAFTTFLTPTPTGR